MDKNVFKNGKIRMLCEGAMTIALAQILGYIKLYDMPSGGAVSFGMLPLFIFCCRWGFAPGMLTAFAYSVLQFLLDGGFAISWQSIIGDYIAAYTVIGLAGLFRRRNGGIFIGTVVGGFARYAVTVVTGAVVWGEYMPDKFFGMTMTSPWLYSALYNSIYIFMSLALCLLAEYWLTRAIKPFLYGEDIARRD